MGYSYDCFASSRIIPSRYFSDSTFVLIENRIEPRIGRKNNQYVRSAPTSEEILSALTANNGKVIIEQTEELIYVSMSFNEKRICTNDYSLANALIKLWFKKLIYEISDPNGYFSNSECNSIMYALKMNPNKDHIDDVMLEIEKNRGTKIDPNILHVFLSTFDIEKCDICGDYFDTSRLDYNPESKKWICK